MTHRRLTALLGGIVFLGGLFIWKVAAPGALSLPGRYDQVGRYDQITRLTDGNERARLKSPENQGLVHLSGQTMGTTYSIKFVPAVAHMGEVAKLKVESVLAEVNSTMSTYDEKSELSRLNQTVAGEPFRCSESLFFVIDLSRQIHEQTKGAFDVTVGPLVRAFGFGAEASAKIPDEAELVQLRELVGMHHLKLNAAERTVEKDRSEVYIDLSAIAKGYGVDQVALALQGLGILDYMVEVGGEIRTRGTKPGHTPWKLAIERPDPGVRRIYTTLSMNAQGASLATSGDYRNFRVEGGLVVSHTMDPRSGRPVPRRTASTSVLLPTAAEADALATALGVMEPNEAIAFANERAYAVLLLLHGSEGKFAPLASREFLARFEVPPG